jgi:hypothetical protein
MARRDRGREKRTLAYIAIADIHARHLGWAGKSGVNRVAGGPWRRSTKLHAVVEHHQQQVAVVAGAELVGRAGACSMIMPGV